MSSDHGDSERPGPPEDWSASEDASLPTQPEGSLVPPPRVPPTATGADAEPLFPRWPRRREPWSQPEWRRRTFQEVANRILDVVDELADRFARQLGLR